MFTTFFAQFKAKENKSIFVDYNIFIFFLRCWDAGAILSKVYADDGNLILFKMVGRTNLKSGGAYAL